MAARVVVAGTIVGTAVWAFELLGRTPTYVPWLRWAVLVAGIAGAGHRSWPRPCPGPGTADRASAIALGLTAALGGPLAYTATTITSPHTGSIPSAGPTVTAAGSGRRTGRGDGWVPGANVGGAPTGAPASDRSGTSPGPGSRPGRGRRRRPPRGGSGAAAGGGPGGLPTGAPRSPAPPPGRSPGRAVLGPARPDAAGGGGAGGTTSSALAPALRAHASSYRWVAGHVRLADGRIARAGLG